MKIERFEDIQSWQEAKKLTAEIYRLTNQEAFSRDFALRDQIRRASVSIMANIAEGFGRNGRKEFMQFLGIANGSTLEVQSHLHVAHELGYITKQQFDFSYQQAHSVSRIIGGFINYLSNQPGTR
ncbi:MAG TPA: four helix bundle protein [Deltaproteobacteria bacterium]|nr:four helix bundle protein [Deltaproteobacteria bacterium]